MKDNTAVTLYGQKNTSSLPVRAAKGIVGLVSVPFQFIARRQEPPIDVIECELVENHYDVMGLVKDGQEAQELIERVTRKLVGDIADRLIAIQKIYGNTRNAPEITEDVPENIDSPGVKIYLNVNNPSADTYGPHLNSHFSTKQDSITFAKTFLECNHDVLLTPYYLLDAHIGAFSDESLFVRPCYVSEENYNDVMRKRSESYSPLALGFDYKGFPQWFSKNGCKDTDLGEFARLVFSGMQRDLPAARVSLAPLRQMREFLDRQIESENSRLAGHETIALGYGTQPIPTYAPALAASAGHKRMLS